MTWKKRRLSLSCLPLTIRVLPPKSPRASQLSRSNLRLVLCRTRVSAVALVARRALRLNSWAQMLVSTTPAPWVLVASSSSMEGLAAAMASVVLLQSLTRSPKYSLLPTAFRRSTPSRQTSIRSSSICRSFRTLSR